MKKFGIGVDIINNSRIKNSITKIKTPKSLFSYAAAVTLIGKELAFV